LVDKLTKEIDELKKQKLTPAVIPLSQQEEERKRKEREEKNQAD